MLEFALTTMTSILFIVDPPGALPAYLAMTQGDDPVQRCRTAWRASLTATLVLAAFAAGGNTLLRLFGLTLPAFRIAGGLIIFLVALEMIHARRTTREGPGETSEGIDKIDVAITPLAVPMLAGPAALSQVTLLMSEVRSWIDAAIVYLAILVTGVACYATLRLAEPVYRGLGRTGINIFSRVFGLVLAALAVQFVLDGLQGAGLTQGK